MDKIKDRIIEETISCHKKRMADLYMSSTPEQKASSFAKLATDLACASTDLNFVSYELKEVKKQMWCLTIAAGILSITTAIMLISMVW